MIGAKEWVAGQRTGIAAYYVHALPVLSGAFRKAYETLCSCLKSVLEAPEADRASRLQGLPASTITLLKQTLSSGKVARDLRALAPVVHAVERRLRTAHDTAPSGLARARLWAFHAMYGTGSPRQVLRLGKSLLSQGGMLVLPLWDKERERTEEAEETVRICLRALRDPGVRLHRRIETLASLPAGLLEQPLWAQVEDVIMRAQFCWPLLVLSDGYESPACSLPVVITVLGDREGRVRVVSSGATLDTDDWQQMLERSVRIAKRLYEEKLGRDRNTTSGVLDADVTFDFSMAEQVVEGILGRNIPLYDRSAEAYFAVATLQRFIGRSNLLSSAVVGHVEGDERRRPLRLALGDCRVEAKLEFAIASNAYERVVLRSRPESSTLAGACEGGPTVQEAETLFNVCDHVLQDSWRQHTYVRAPDLCWALHSSGRPGLLPAHHLEVSAVRGQLRDSTKCILTLDKPPQVVMSALRHIDSEVSGATQENTGISWAVFRPLENEQDTRFCCVLHRIIGATHAEFEAFAARAEFERAVEGIEALMSRFTPDEEHPGHHAPDVLVVIGAVQIAKNARTSLNPESRPFMTQRMLEALAERGKMSRTSISRAQSLLGATRIILVPHDDHGVHARDSVRPGEGFHVLDGRGREAIRRLAAFEWGFAIRDAQAVLELPDDQTRRELVVLTRSGMLREQLGQWHVPAHVRAALDLKVEARDMYRAGCALAPLVAGGKEHLADLDRALDPLRIHEAEYYFKKANRTARDSGDESTATDATVSLGNLSRYAVLPSWGLVGGLLKAKGLGEDAFLLSVELLKRCEEQGTPLHPSWLRNAAAAAAQWAKANQRERGTLIEIAQRYYQEAIAACERYPDEAPANRLNVRAAYAVFLSQQMPSKKRIIDEECTLALEEIHLRGANPRLAPGDWWELLGDSQCDHPLAQRPYAVGMAAVPEYAQLTIKAIGAALAWGNKTHAQAVLTALLPAEARRIHGAASNAFNRVSRSTRVAPWVHLRWRLGMAALDKRGRERC